MRESYKPRGMDPTKRVPLQFCIVDTYSSCEPSRSESRRKSALASIPCNGLRNSSNIVSTDLSPVELFHLREMLLMKSDFILLAVTASNREISTVIELVKAERYEISLSTVKTGTAD